jgi:hypothetical protein
MSWVPEKWAVAQECYDNEVSCAAAYKVHTLYISKQEALCEFKC